VQSEIIRGNQRSSACNQHSDWVSYKWTNAPRLLLLLLLPPPPSPSRITVDDWIALLRLMLLQLLLATPSQTDRSQLLATSLSTGT
jgi:hypothetical protein